MASSGPAVHTGYWVDHSKGSVLGGTLTYSSGAGSQLISAAAILVQLVGASVWAIVAFWIHQHAVTRGLQDEYDAQKQAILRNTGSSVGAVRSLFSLGYVWHKHTPRAWRRATGHMLWPILIFAGFTVSGVFVGRIAANSDQSRVLLKSGTCGTLQIVNNDFTSSVKFQQLFANISRVADAYARDCYARSTTDAVTCASYATPTLKYIKYQNGSCPIGRGNCATNDSEALSLQALHIDSHDDLGINANPADRLQLRYNATCAPVNRTLIQRLSSYDNSSGIRDANFTYPRIGLNIGQDTYNEVQTPYVYDTVLQAWGFDNARYSVTSYRSPYPHTADSSIGWIPVRPFNQSTADVSIFIISPNGVVYSAPNQDLIFGTQNTTVGDLEFYLPDYYFRALACGEDYQICKDDGKTCTAWVPFAGLSDEIDRLQLSPAQNATWNRIGVTIYSSYIQNVATTSSPLRAADELVGSSVSTGLPDNQWTLEIEAWYQATLARMQYIAQTFVSLPANYLDQIAAAGVAIVPPDTPELQKHCSQQRIQSPAGYTSYNVFALVFIFVVSALIIGAAIFVSEYGHRLPGRYPGGKNYFKLLAYRADGTLQLQRMALESAGLGGWRSGRGHKKDVPYTEHGRQRVPPPVKEVQSSPMSRQNTIEGSVDGDEGVDDGLLYYEKAGLPEDESDGSVLK